MEHFNLKTAVAFFIFNRPDNTKQVFKEIRRARPPKLLVVADGPRTNVPAENEKCSETRAIIDSVDWECEVIKNYADANMGCKKRVSSGLNWVFDQVEEAIILEDDCLPHPTFFRFCQEMLQKYQNEEKIMMISGDNFQFGKNRSEYSYYFSRHFHIWGWASWRRAWRHYDVNMKTWPEARDAGLLENWFSHKRSIAYWKSQLEKTYRGEIDTWDYQWNFACWAQNGLAVLPNVNVVSNTGFSQDATHTDSGSAYACMKTEPIAFPLRHPPGIERNITADRFTQATHYSPDIFSRTKNKLIKFGLLPS